MIARKFEPILFGLVLSGLMSLVVSGISTVVARGIEVGYFSVWLHAWLIAWLLAFPTVLVIAPRARRIVTRMLAQVE